MTREHERQEFLRFLQSIQRPDRPIESLQDEDHLADYGLGDSLSLLEIILYFEERYGLDFSERGIDPDELGTVGSLLDLLDPKS